MKKRVLTALLVLCLSLSLTMPGWAAGIVPSPGEVSQAISALGIWEGSTNLSHTVTRAEFVTMAVKASPGGGQIGTASTSPYPDVPYTHWSAGYIEAGISLGLVTAYSDGTFRPDTPITLAEGVTILLTLLGYVPQDFSGAYPTPQLVLYRSLDLDQGVSAQNATDTLTQQDAMYLFYNLLATPTKEGTAYATQLGHSLTSAGELDLVSLINSEMEGPLVASENWQASIPFSLAGVTVQRDGSASSLQEIQKGDLIYWNQAMHTLWVSSQRVTGTIQAVEPSASQPASVQILGRTYSIESAQAAYALSDLGPYRLGSTVTLLLGRSGGVAAVIAPSAVQNELCGVVIQTERGNYPDSYGGTYAADQVTILATDGGTYQYQWTANYLEPGDPVGVSFSPEGQVVLKRLYSARVEGQVSQDGARVGTTSFAPDAEILDVTGRRAVRIFPSRLAGLKLTQDKVTYCSLNQRGEISRMILKDVTGDAGQYGVLTHMDSMGEGMFAYYSYQYDWNGTSYTLPSTTTRYPVQTGPIQITGNPADPDRLLPLTRVKGDGVLGRLLLADGQSYPIAEQVAVYEYRNREYFLSTLDRVQEQGLSLTGWYDRPMDEGGRIRVILAQ